MRLTDVREVHAPAEQVWAALHDTAVLRRVIPGCERLQPVGGGQQYAATMAVRVGPVSDRYRGTFCIDDLHGGRELAVTITARGRCGSVEVDLDVRVSEGPTPATSTLHYDARARVGGLVRRVGGPALALAGSQVTTCFFRDLERAVTRTPVVVPVQRVPIPVGH